MTSTNFSNVASFNPSKDLNVFIKSFAVLTPRLGIPKEYINLYNSGFLLLSTASKRFWAFLGPNFSKVIKSSLFNLYKSAIDLISSFSNSCSAVFSEKPYIFIASLEAKWTILLTICGLHDKVFSQK